MSGWEFLALIPFLVVFIIMIFLGIAILGMVFWIWMIIDAAQKKFKTDGEKIAWVIVVVFLGLLGALIYYFVVKYNS